MRRSVSIGGLALIVALGAAGLGVGHKSSIARAQDKPSSAEVKIDNFSFGPASLTAPIGLSVSSWEALDTGKKYSRKSDDRKGMNIEAKVQ